MREREVQLLFYNVQPGKCTLITGGFNLFHNRHSRYCSSIMFVIENIQILFER